MSPSTPDGAADIKAAARATARTLTQWPLVVVLLVVGGGLVAAALGHWRGGAIVVGAGLLLGGVLRAALPRRQAGLLIVRGRAFDILALAGAGTAIIVLALSR